jgi:RNA polymerase sigma-70 factor (ECF subfamily)
MTELTYAAAKAPPGRAAARVAADPRWLAERALTVARRTALGVLGDSAAADDVAQEVAITALRQAHALRDPDKADAWLHRIAVRSALKEARRGTLRRSAEIARHDRHPPGSTDGLDGVLTLLEGLPTRQRVALTLRYVHDLPDGAIAAALRCREATVRSLLHRGRETLRTRLTDDEVSR